MRALCISERGVGTGVVVVWLASRAPTCVIVRVCGLLGDMRV